MAKRKLVSGCVIQRSGVYHVVVSYYVGDNRLQDTTSTGLAVASHQKSEAEKIRDRLVQEKLEEFEREALEKSKHSFADCFEKWIDYKSNQIECTTAWGYKNRSKTIIEYFREKNTKIEDLEPKHIVKYYEWALANGRRNVYNENMSTGLSRRTVSDQASLIRTFLKDAIVQGVITKNPADAAEVPRVKKSNIEEIAYMDKEQAKAFLNFIKSEPLFERLYCLSKVGLYYGLRRSELLGLRWSVIDFEKGVIEINHTVVRSEQGDVYRNNVKSKSSHRCLPLLNGIKGDLLDVMENQKKLGIYSKDGYVFKWEDGRVYSPDYITKHFKKAVIRCGKVPEDLTVHGLRHSCCAILFEGGWELAEVQNWLGHSDINVTANIYNHVSMKWKNQHGKRADEIFI